MFFSFIFVVRVYYRCPIVSARKVESIVNLAGAYGQLETDSV